MEPSLILCSNYRDPSIHFLRSNANNTSLAITIAIII